MDQPTRRLLRRHTAKHAAPLPAGGCIAPGNRLDAEQSPGEPDSGEVLHWLKNYPEYELRRFTEGRPQVHRQGTPAALLEMQPDYSRIVARLEKRAARMAD